MNGRLLIIALLVLFLACGAAYAQCDGKRGPDGLTWDFDEQEKPGFSIVRFMGDALTPQSILDTRAIRAYVRDGRFRELTARCGDMRAIDGIFLKALRIAEYHLDHALFLSMTAVLEHRHVTLDVPVVRSLALPLTFEEDSLFALRVRHLPRRAYADSPAGDHGDKDKLQHFFASAYLAYVSGSPGLARSAGNLIEWGEAKFVVGGVDDPRDRRANKHGEAFGRDLLTVKTLLPSDYLTLPYDDGAEERTEPR